MESDHIDFDPIDFAADMASWESMPSVGAENF